MATQFRAEHELPRRRRSRNIGLGVTLVLCVVLVYALTIAKLGTDPNDALGSAVTPPAATTGEGSQ